MFIFTEEAVPIYLDLGPVHTHSRHHKTDLVIAVLGHPSEKLEAEVRDNGRGQTTNAGARFARQ